MINSKFLEVKLAGGATAQVLGLITAIYAGSKVHKPFKISYFPYSTGTFWPFAIDFLLEDSELLDSETLAGHFQPKEPTRAGEIIYDHPLLKKRLSYEHFVSLARSTGTLPKLLKLRQELYLTGSSAQVHSISKYYNKISGKFPQMNIDFVNQELDRRFRAANRKSPLSRTSGSRLEGTAVLHYRLGDKKKNHSTPKDFADDGIIHPESYLTILKHVAPERKREIFVISDEPNLAIKLLSTVGINAKLHLGPSDIWEDLYFMSQAGTFIGGFHSQVTQLANIFVEHNGGNSFLLVPDNFRVSEFFANTSYFHCRYLPATHSVYK